MQNLPGQALTTWDGYLRITCRFGEVGAHPACASTKSQGIFQSGCNIIEIILPHPPRELHPNARPHFRRKADLVKQYRGCAHIAAKAQMNELRWRSPPQWKRATVEVIFFYKTNRQRDKDNLLASLKAAFDGIADSRLVANDSGLTFLPVRVVYNKNERETVSLIITEVR